MDCELHSCVSRFGHRITVAHEGDELVMRFNGLKESAAERDTLEARQPYVDLQHTALALNPEARRVLVLGLGAGLLARAWWQAYPELEIDAVEIDEQVIDIAHRFFGLVADERMRLHNCCGREFLERTRERYDIVVVDVFTDRGPVYALATVEFMALVACRLSPGGVLAYNMVGIPNGRGSRTFHRFVKTVRGALPDVYAFPTRPGHRRIQNIEVFAMHGGPTAEELRRRIDSRLEGRIARPGFERFAEHLYEGPFPERVRPFFDAEEPRSGVVALL